MTLNLPDSKARYLIGVSGGPDSVALLKAMTEAGCHCIVAHCNFSLRGEESDGDEAFVRHLCDEMRVQCVTVRFETENVAKEKGISIEMAARELRYEWFEKMRIEHGCDYIAVAHNLNDQVETFFLNLARGTGLKGLCGMEWINGRIVRPLLSVTRDEILAYADNYRLDHTNDDVKYKRNRIRHNIIPEMQQLNPSFLRTMEKTIENLKSAQSLLEETLDSISTSPRISSTSRTSSISRISSISRTSISSRPEELYLQLQGLGFNRDQILQIARAEQSQASGKRFISPKAEVVINRGKAIIYPKTEYPPVSPPEHPSNSCRDARPCVSQNMLDAQPCVSQNMLDAQPCVSQNMLDANPPVSPNPTANSQLSIEETPTTLNLTVGDAHAQISKSKLKGTLILRHWKPGERFQPSGMHGKSKKISDFLTALKMDVVEKERQLVVADKTETEERIVWIVGKRVDERYLV